MVSDDSIFIGKYNYCLVWIIVHIFKGHIYYIYRRFLKNIFEYYKYVFVCILIPHWLGNLSFDTKGNNPSWNGPNISPIYIGSWVWDKISFHIAVYAFHTKMIEYYKKNIHVPKQNRIPSFQNQIVLYRVTYLMILSYKGNKGQK